MAYLLATPNTRRKIVFTQAIFFPNELELKRYFILNIGLYGLLFFIGGLCFFSSCVFQNKKYSYGFGAGLTIAFVLIQMLSQVNEKLEKLKYFTPFTLFNVQDIVAGKNEAVLQFLVLYAMGIVLFFLGIKRFEKRDLSL